MRHRSIALYGHWPPGKHRALPAHRNVGLEVVLIVRGQLTWQVEGRVEPVLPGSVFFTLPWEMHGSVREREPGCELFYVVVRLDRTWSRPSRTFGFHRDLGLSPRLMRQVRQSLLAAPRRSWLATTRLAMLIPELVGELKRPDSSREAIAALTRLVLIELQRSVRGEASSRPQPAAEQRVRQFVDRMREECHRPWTLATLAEACDLGRSRFTTILTQITGDSPMRALSRARVDRAQHLLANTNWPVTRIALECGFGSSQHFAAVFRAYTGCTARQYRQQHTRT